MSVNIIKKHTFFALLLCFAFVSCNKIATKYNPNFEGTWRTVPVYDSTLGVVVQSEIVIQGQEGAFKNACKPCDGSLCNCMNEQFGKAVVDMSHTQLRIGSGNYPLSINQEPKDSSGIWTMRINNLKYIRQ